MGRSSTRTPNKEAAQDGSRPRPSSGMSRLQPSRLVLRGPLGSPTGRQESACSSAQPLPTARVGRKPRPRRPAPPPAPPVAGGCSRAAGLAATPSGPDRSRRVLTARLATARATEAPEQPGATVRAARPSLLRPGRGGACGRRPAASAFARAVSANERARAAFESQRPRAGRLRPGRRGGARLGRACLVRPGSRLGAGGPGAGKAPGPGGGASGLGRPRLLQAARPDCLLLATTPARTGPGHAEPSIVTSQVPGSRRPLKSPPGGHVLRPPRRGLGPPFPGVASRHHSQLGRARRYWRLLPALSPQAVPGRPPSPLQHEGPGSAAVVFPLAPAPLPSALRSRTHSRVTCTGLHSVHRWTPKF